VLQEVGAKMTSPKVKVFGIAGWRLVPEEPRHNTWHNALSDASKIQNIDLEYLGLINTHKTNWIKQLLPDSILKRFPYIGPFSFFRILKKIRSSRSEKTILYIFEGSLFWVFVLNSVRVFVPNCVIICNLFPSSRYDSRFYKNEKMKPWYRLFFRIIQHNKRVIITFDTQLMSSKVNKYIKNKINRFPVPSSFPFNKRDSLKASGHYRVLVNLRSYPTEEIHFLLQNSCSLCTFVFPRGPLATTPLSIEFGKYRNASFDGSVIPVTEYQDYIDTFDYMIFLYRPSIDASGRILDSITRGVPICVPKQAIEWSYISKTWGQSNLFDWNSPDDIARTFNHPIFNSATINGAPPFTPNGSLDEIIKLGTSPNQSQRDNFFMNKALVIFALALHSAICAGASFTYQLGMKLRSFVSR
jgi:hypothetical protein